MDIKDVWVRPGKIWALVAAFSVENATETQQRKKTVGVYMKVDVVDAVLFTKSYVNAVVTSTLVITKTLF